MSHYAPTPASICDEIITALSAVFLAPTGKVKTIKRLAGELNNSAALDRILTSGSPAMLIAYMGGTFKPQGTHNRVFVHNRLFSVICCAGSYQDNDTRFENDAQSVPGIEQLLDWATYYTFRTLRNNSDLRNVKVLEHKPLRYETGKYVFVAEFSCDCNVDFWDDTPEAQIDKLGIVHDPTDPSDLWEEDNETPISDMPTTTDGGVLTL